jgi:hypothetical protein
VSEKIGGHNVVTKRAVSVKVTHRQGAD